MGLIKSCRGFHPELGKDCYVAENATLVGDVIAGDECSFWFNSVVRGDVNSIRLGNRVNIQDGAVLHCTYEKTKCILGDYVSVGHNAIVHGCEIQDNVVVGMGAIVMDRAVVQSNVFIAAGAVVLEGAVLESGYLYAGIPAKKIKPLDERHIKGEIERIGKNYVKYSSWFK